MTSGVANKDEHLESYLEFFKELQALTNKIHATDNVDQIMLDLSENICHLFDCDRLTLYAVSAGKTYIETKIKTGMHSFKDFTLPISEKSIAGYVALTRKSVNIANVYDEAELKQLSPDLEFMHKVDKRTGYRTQQMLAGPLVNGHSGELLGVVELINTHSGLAFSALMEEGFKELCETLSIAFVKRLRPAIRSKYDALVSNAIVSASELELASRSARRKHDDIEAVLINQFQVELGNIGEALATFYGLTYEPYRQERSMPATLLKGFKREFVESSQWLPLAEIEGGVIVLTTAPDRVRGSRIVQNLFPNANLIFRVTTGHEFRRTVDQFFGRAEETEPPKNVRNNRVAPKPDDAEQLAERIGSLIRQAFAQNAQDIRIKLTMTREPSLLEPHEEGKPPRLGGQVSIDFDVDCQ
jgi:hypothetical protein